ncbi:Xrs2p Ecym_4761 [Eremothecium cymbalariae DBVPG|uniref:Uncharacterized protein n=1 Tax=Eremothecium cymbalariae (strain CBS 270.75 / DBVPG 7215 / KCTC 17166 / NRRL Y-17582) TaxID=931890 RepID=G8JSQ1_ERECY|nr:hypothetical protein Ecym_4761 [Eremothecium cymbalariae DBVPG\
MWIFKCQYQNQKDPDTLNAISSVIKPDKNYIVGRASKSSLVIDERGVSRTHLQLKANRNIIEITLLGAQLKIGHKTIEKGISCEFHPKQSPLRLEVGSHSIECKLLWTQWEFKVPSDLEINYIALTKMFVQLGIKIVFSLSKETSHQIVRSRQGQKDYDKYLFALVKGLPLVEVGFLKGISSLLNSDTLKFESKVKELEREFSIFPEFNPIPNPLKGLYFIVPEKDEFDILKYTIEVGGGTVYNCITFEDFVKVTSTIPSSKVILIKCSNNISPAIDTQKPTDHNILLEKAHSIGFKQHDTRELTIAVLNNNFEETLIDSSISDKRLISCNSNDKLKTTSTSLEDGLKVNVSATSGLNLNTEGPPAKKRRINSVKPLDSLSFFAGGSIERSTRVERNSSEKQTVQPAEHNKIAETSIASIELLPTKSGIKEITDVVPETENEPEPMVSPKKRSPAKNESLADMRAGDNHVSIKTTLEVEKSAEPSHKKLKVEGIFDEKVEMSNEQKYHLNAESKDSTLSTQSHSSIVNAIKEIKEREVSRIKTTIVEIGPDELTEEAICKLSTLAVVESVDMLRKTQSRHMKTETNKRHHVRRNFKRFVKVWPAYLNKAICQDPMGAQRYSNRQCVPLKVYEPMNKNELTDDQLVDENSSEEKNDIMNETFTSDPLDHNIQMASKSIPRHHDSIYQSKYEQVLSNPELEFSFSTIRNSNSSESVTNNPGNSLFVVEDESDDNTAVTYHNLSATSATRTEGSDVSIQARTSRIVTRPKNNATVLKYIGNEEDDEDDEDEAPRFAFRRTR